MPRRLTNVKVVALAPNLKGFQRALEAGAHKVTFPVSASRKHSESNVRMTPEQMVEEVRKCAQHPHPGVEIEGAVSTAFGCTLQGEVPEDDVVRIAVALAEFCDCVALADTVGYANPAADRDGFSGESELRSAKSSKPRTCTTPAASASPTRSPPTRKACATSTARWAAWAAARSRPARAAT